VNPVSHMTTALREIMGGDVTFPQIGLALLAPAVITAACAPLVMRLYNRER
jgi:ABC-2 type transport system permease protein